MRMSTQDRAIVRGRAALTAVGVTCIHLFLDLTYRAWAIEKSRDPLWDWGLASSFTQITSIIGMGALMVIWELRPANSTNLPFGFYVVTPAIAMLLYEILQIWLPATFDMMDVAYCGLGVIANFLILRYVIFQTTRELSGDRDQ